MNKKKKLKEIAMISIGILLVNIGFYFFLTPISLVTGGAMGIALMIKDLIYPVPMAAFIYAFNIISLIFGLIFLGKDFFFKTIYASILSPTIVLIFELFTDSNYFMNQVTESKYLIATICSSFLISIGIGISIRNNGSSGGMDVFQLIMAKYAKIPLSKTMYFTDMVIVILGGFTFISGINYNIESVVYGIICVLLVAYFVEFIALRGRFMRTAYIISKNPDDIKKMIYDRIGRGVTFCKVTGGYTNEEKTMVICTMDKSEAYKLSGYVKAVDPTAFTFVTVAKEVIGEYDT